MTVIDVRALVQSTLDTALLIRSFWQSKVETAGEDPDEYVVYTLDNDAPTYADNLPTYLTANIAVRYYYRMSLLETQANRTAVKSRERAIYNALQGAGFSISAGPFDVGDIDDIGFGASVYECYYERTV